jgi:hypothetical protein
MAYDSTSNTPARNPHHHNRKGVRFMANSRKESQSTAHQVRWHDGTRWNCVEVRGEVQMKRLKSTLAALPWVSLKSIEFKELRR